VAAIVDGLGGLEMREGCGVSEPVTVKLGRRILRRKIRAGAAGGFVGRRVDGGVSENQKNSAPQSMAGTRE
jgi:hypothetical protein